MFFDVLPDQSDRFVCGCIVNHDDLAGEFAFVERCNQRVERWNDIDLFVVAGDEQRDVDLSIRLQ